MAFVTSRAQLVCALSLGVSETVKFVANTLRPDSVPACHTWSQDTIFSPFTTQMTQRYCQVKYSQQTTTLSTPGIAFDLLRYPRG